MAKVYLFSVENLIVPDVFDGVASPRREYILSISNQKRRRESFFVWKLLQFALKNEGVKDPSFYNDKGKWGIKGDEIKFSLSHSHNLVCVAVSKLDVGVDVEKISKKLLALKKRYSSPMNGEDELEFIAKRWTEEEALFKRNSASNVKSFVVIEKEEKYCLSVATDEEVEIIKINNLN